MKPRSSPAGAVVAFKPSRPHCFYSIALSILFCLYSLSAVAQQPTSLPLPNIEFQLYFHRDGANFTTRHYTLDGPVNGGPLYSGLRLVRVGGGTQYFATERQDVYELDAPRGTFTAVPLGEISPQMEAQGWPTGLGYDAERGQIVLVSLGGEGFIHAYSPATDRWSLVSSMDNWDFDTIEHHGTEDAYYGVQTSHLGSRGDLVPLHISRVGTNGEHGATITIPNLPFGIGFSDHEAELVSIGEHLVLLLEPGRTFYDKGQAKESRIYLINPSTHEARLTYRKVWEQWPPQSPPADFELSFYPTSGLSVPEGRVFTRLYNANGPRDGDRLLPGTRVVSDAARTKFFGTHWHEVYNVDARTEALENMDLDAGVPELSWPMGVAFDSLRNRLLVVSLGGEGFLYAYSLENNQWSTVANMDNRDFDSIFYHRGLDQIVAFGHNGNLHTLNANGAMVGQIDLPLIGLHLGPGGYQSEMALSGDRVALLLEPDRPHGLQAGDESRIYMIDLQAGTAEMTYRKIWTAPPTNEIPMVGIRFVQDDTTQPWPNADYAPGSLIITRTGSIAEPLLVFFEVSGTATPDVDYERIVPTSVLIPAGHTSARIKVVAKDDSLDEANETVIVTLIPTPPTVDPAYPSFYKIDGARRSAELVIRDKNGGAGGIPVVRVVASDPQATEFSPLADGIDSARLVISRTGRLSGSQMVFFSIHGTANNGEDYRRLPPYVTIPAGRESIEIEIVPIEAGTGADEKMETVGLRLEGPPVLSILPSYLTDPFQRQAGAVIFERSQPGAGAIEVIIPGARRSLHAADAEFLAALYHPSQVAFVDFYVDGRKVGSSASVMDHPIGGLAFHSFKWSQATAGQHILQAKTTLPTGQQLVSSEIPFVIEGGSIPPVVRITQPSSGSIFTEGTPIEVAVTTSERDGFVQRVELLANGILLQTIPAAPSSTFRLTWTNPPAGEHALVARAFDNRGAVGISAAVRILVRPIDSAAFVQRDLPPAYSPGAPFSVILKAIPPAGTRAYAVEDRPPVSWQVSSITHDGVVDPVNGKVKFGPFTDSQPRVFTYRMTPPSASSGPQEFSGSSSRDGAIYPIGGDRVIEGASGRHPADHDENNSISLSELTGYAAAWKAGGPRTGLAPIPADFVTRAALIWKRGEAYRFVSAAAPLCWIPESESNTVLRSLSAGSAERLLTLSPTEQGASLVQITVRPAAAATSYAVEEKIPSGWSPANVSAGGTFDPQSGCIRWGVFLDNVERAFSYTISGPAKVASIANLGGTLSSDGETSEVNGATRLITSGSSVQLSFGRSSTGQIELQISGPSGQTGAIEFSSDLVNWATLKPVFLPDGALDLFDDPAGADHSRFYRFRVE